MGYLVNNPAGYLIDTQTSSGAGNVMDTRAAANYGFIQYQATASAVIKVQASVDTTGWMDVATYTATPTTASAQLAGYYPYMRGVVNTAYSNGTAWLYYAPGLK